MTMIAMLSMIDDNVYCQMIYLSVLVELWGQSSMNNVKTVFLIIISKRRVICNTEMPTIWQAHRYARLVEEEKNIFRYPFLTICIALPIDLFMVVLSSSKQ